MTEFSYHGPSGETLIKQAWPVRMVRSPIFLFTCCMFAAFWGLSYFYRYDHTPFLGTQLSLDHYPVRYNCRACHEKWGKVSNVGCLAKSCHGEKLLGSIHDTLTEPCIECHPEHWEGKFLPREMKNSVCADCHHLLEKDPESKFHPENRARRKLSGVSRDLFRHKTHWWPVYDCSVCHCAGERSINIPLARLFTMEACCTCHYKTECQLCHHYHDHRESRPLYKTCIKQENLDKLRGDTKTCVDVFVEELVICETGEPAARQDDAESKGSAP